MCIRDRADGVAYRDVADAAHGYDVSGGGLLHGYALQALKLVEVHGLGLAVRGLAVVIVADGYLVVGVDSAAPVSYTHLYELVLQVEHIYGEGSDESAEEQQRELCEYTEQLLFHVHHPFLPGLGVVEEPLDPTLVDFDDSEAW